MPDRARDESMILAAALAASVLLHALALAFGGLARHADLTPPAPLPPAPAKAEPVPPKAKAAAARPKPEPRPEETRPILTAPEPSPTATTIAPAPAAPPAASAPAAAVPAGTAGGIPAGGGDSVVPPSYKAAYLQNPAPRYPQAAKRNGEEGTVLLRVLVTPDGKAAKVDVDRTSGSTVLDAAAADAVSRWRFVPARRGADPVEAWVVVPMVFRLEAAN